MTQQGYGPAFLPVGTDVSAKYRGAFCEAKVKSVVKAVKCKVQMKDSQIPVAVTDEDIKGFLKIGGVVEVKHPDTGHMVEATIHKLNDHSLYTVVFDDGDERTLRRTQLCLKGDKHFIESETLDNLPLSHPEHFGTPVLQSKKVKRKTDDDDDDGNEDESEEETSPRRVMYRGRHQELLGKLFIVDVPNRKGMSVPALVVLPDSNSMGDVKRSDQILVRSFKDSKYLTVTRKHLKEFSRTAAIKNEDKTMRTAFEKALLYFDTKELPVGWKRDDMLGSDVEDEDSVEDNEYASEDEPYEEKDRFVAQLYKFMDDRGTPINKGPCIGNKDLNLYKLFKIVHNHGGYNKVTKEMKWHVVYSKMGLPSLHQNPAHQVKSAYKKYLDAYETFYRKLGNSMGSGTVSRPGRARQNSGRSILNYRSREKSPRLPKPNIEKKEEQESPKPKTDVVDKCEESHDSGSVGCEESDVIPRRTMQRRERVQVAKEREESREKEKKEDIVKAKDKKEDAAKAKKEEANASAVKSKKEEVCTPVGKSKKEEVTSKSKKEETSGKKEERKSVRKAVKVEEDKEEKDDKKPVRAIRKEKEEAPTPDPAKKRLTRRKLLKNEPQNKEESKDESPEDKKEPVRKGVVVKELRASVGERKEKEIPRTLERRDSKASEKKILAPKAADIKPTADKKVMVKPEEKKLLKRDKKGKESEKEEEISEGENEEDSTEDIKQDKASTLKIEYPVGYKLRVKYGKGKNQKMYTAKVVDTSTEGLHRTYLVHYAGWNTRYDEWIKGDRVASILDRPGPEPEKTETPKRVEIAKTGLKVHKPLSTSLKRLTTHRTPMLAKKTGQIFRTPKHLTAKTRATRSSSSETNSSSSSPTVTSDKRATRRRSVVADPSGGKQEENQAEEADDSITMEERESPSTREEEVDDDTQDINVEEEDQESGAVEKSEDTTVEEDTEEMETEEDLEQTVKTELAEPQKDTKVESAVEVEEETEEKSESEKTVTKVEHEDELVEEINEGNKSEEAALSPVKSEKPSVMVAEIKSADSEITSVLLSEEQVEEEEEVSKPEVATIDETEANEEDEKTEKLEEKANDVSEIKDDSLAVDNLSKDKEEQNKASKPEVHTNIEEEEENNFYQSIPLLKKMEVEIDKKEVDRSKGGKGRKKETGKDGKKNVKSGMDVAAVSAEIPTLEPIMMTSEPTEKTSPSPYDFDDAETESQWQPDLSKKWEVAASEQTPRSKEDTPVSGDVMDKEKKKVKKKTKKKLLNSPSPVSESKVEEVPCSSQSVESVPHAAESSINEEDKLAEKQGLKKKGRKRKDTETKLEVIEQYESTVKSVVEAVKHSLKEESPERENNKPAPKKRRLKRASESDKKEPGRVFKAERRKGLRDSQDTVEALNVEGSKRKSAIHEASLLENVAALKKSSHSKDSDHVPEDSDKSENKVESSGIDSALAGSTQPFVPQTNEERESSTSHFENTPPTTPEHEEGEGATVPSQPVQSCASPCSDDLTSKPESLKDGSSSSSSSSSISLPASSTHLAPAKSASDSPSDNDVGSTTSNDNLDSALAANQHSESSGTEHETSQSRKRKPVEDPPTATSTAKKKKRVHGTRSRTAKKSPKYISTDSVSYQTRAEAQLTASVTTNHFLESPLSRLADLAKSPRPSKYNFNADLGEYLEGEERCNFLIGKMKEIKAIYMNLKSEVASIDRRRKRIRRKERESSQTSPNDRDGVR